MPRNNAARGEPCSPDSATGDEPRATVSAAHTLAPTGARILIVDDNPRVRRSTAAALSRIGFHVMTAEDGAPAIQIAETTPPDLAIIDFEMPTPGIVVVRAPQRALRQRGVGRGPVRR